MQSLQHTSNGSSGSCAREVLDCVPPVVWFIRRHMRSYRRGLSLPQFRALVFIDAQPAASLSAVAEHLGATLPTASRSVGGLVTKGLITRQRSRKDRRHVALAITARGSAVLNAARQGTQKQLADELDRISPSQRESVTAAMHILKDVFGTLGCRGRANGTNGTGRKSTTKNRAENTVDAATARREMPMRSK